MAIQETISQTIKKVQALPKKFLFGGGFILLLLLTLLLALLSPQSPLNPGKKPQVSETVLKQMTPEEQNIPEATPQQFYHQEEAKEYGTLIVTSDPSEARVIIDQSEHGSTTEAFEVPIQTTPLTVYRIPVGKHELMIVKPGYNVQEDGFEIKKDEVTRLNYTLEAL